MTVGGHRMLLRNRAFFASLVGQVGISERELGRRAGLSHSTVDHLVTGRRTSCSAATAIEFRVWVSSSTRTAARQARCCAKSPRVASII